MEENVKQDEKTSRKYSYEELANFCNQLVQQNNKLREDIAKLNLENYFSNLSFLLRIISIKDNFTDKEFVLNCEKEVIAAFTPQKEKNDSGEKEKSESVDTSSKPNAETSESAPEEEEENVVQVDWLDNGSKS